MDAGQVAEQAEHRDDTGKASEYGRGEVMPFEAAERERAAGERDRQRRLGNHSERGRPGSRHPRWQPAIDAEINAEQVLAEIERSDSRHYEADCECEA